MDLKKTISLSILVNFLIFSHIIHSATSPLITLDNYATLDPQVAQFLKDLAKQNAPPIYTLPLEKAREVFNTVQKTDPDSLLPVNIQKIKIDSDSKNGVSVEIEIIRPIKSRGPLPVIMYFHGGGWILGGSYSHARLVRELAYGANAAVVFVNFTSSPEAHYPLPIEQAYLATSYIAKHGKKLNLDTSRIAVAGDSVGGNMATVVALLAKERGGPEIIYQALFYPVTDAAMDTASYKEFGQKNYWLTQKAMEWFWNAYAPTISQREIYTISPLKATLEQLRGLPPTLVINAENDVLRDEGEAYAHKLMHAGVPVSMIRFGGTIHDFMLLEALKDTIPTKNAIRFASSKLKEAFDLAL